MDEMKDMQFCQSCGMPMTREEMQGTEADGSRSEDYCAYCYKDGAFTAQCAMEEMIGFCAPLEVKAGRFPDEAAARAALGGWFPQLKRWRKG